MQVAPAKGFGNAKRGIEQIASGLSVSGTLPYAIFWLSYSTCETLQGQSKVKKSLLASFRRTSLSHGSLQNQTT
jgi:hypothetical protein